MTAADHTWFKPAEAAPLLGRTTREVQALCAAEGIEHQRKESPGGRVRYLISQGAIDRFLNRTLIRSKRGAA